jgi:hypothetical protein
VDGRIQAGKDILSSGPNRLILGLILTGLGLGLIASAYIQLRGTQHK